MKRKILAGLLSLCMMVSLVPTTVFAETAKTLPVAKVDRADGMVTITSGDEADTRHFDGSYVVYDLLGTGAGNSSSSEPFDLQIAMDFEAIDKTSEAAQATGYGDYITDFFITFDGLENDSFVADNCYLAGYYADVDMWVQIPLYGFTVNEGTLYPVITSAGFDWSYETICTVVEKFTCGIFLDEEILEENPDIEVTLTLGLIDPEVYSGPLDVKEDIIVVVDDFTYGLEDLVECEAKIGERYYTTLEAAVAAGGEVTLLKDAEIETTLKVKKDVKLDLNGWTLTAPHNYNNGGQNLYGFIVEEGATLTLDDSSEAQTGEISCKYSGIETKGGTFVMDGGKIT